MLVPRPPRCLVMPVTSRPRPHGVSRSATATGYGQIGGAFELAHRWRALFREWDVVLCPAMPTTAFAHDQAEMHTRVLDVDGVPMLVRCSVDVEQRGDLDGQSSDRDADRYGP